MLSIISAALEKSFEEFNWYTVRHWIPLKSIDSTANKIKSTILETSDMLRYSKIKKKIS